MTINSMIDFLDLIRGYVKEAEALQKANLRSISIVPGVILCYGGFLHCTTSHCMSSQFGID